MKTKKLLSLILLTLLCSIGHVWGNQTDLISGVTLPDMPATSLDMASQTFKTPDANGWIVMEPNADIRNASVTWFTALAWNTSKVEVSDVSSYTAPFFTIASKTAITTIQKGDRTKAIRFTGAEKASFLCSGTNSARCAKVSLYSVSGETQTLVETKATTYSESYDELLFNGLSTSTNYVAYMYGDNTGSDGNSVVVEIAIKKPTGPTINTQPQGASYATGQEISALTVAATASKGILTYQWYTCDDSNKTNAEEIDGETSASYSPSAAGFYYVVVGDGNGSTTSNVVQITVSAASAPTKPTVSGTPESSVYKNAEVTLVASSSGVPTPTYQWYSNTTNAAAVDNEHKISGAESASYSPSTTTLGTKYYYVVATNSEGSQTSAVQTVTVIGHSDCLLSRVLYSNGFDAFIVQPQNEAHGTIKAYYIAGESAPTITSATVSDYASYNVVGNTLTVTAEDESTTAIFDITIESVIPYSGTGTYNFGGTESWIKNIYGYTSDGWKISKPVEENNNRRVSEGKCRMYIFLAPNTSLKFKNIADNRNLDVYKNGTKIYTDKSFTKNTEVTLDINSDDACMITLVNKSNGDTKLKYVTITKSGFESGIISELGWNSFATSSKLDLSDMTGGTAYAVSAVSAASATLTEFGDVIVASGTGILINGTPYAAYKISTSSETATFNGTNKLVGTTSAITGDALSALSNPYVLGKVDDEAALCKFTGTTIPANKAYLPSSEVPTLAPGIRFIIGENNNATNLQNVESNEMAVKFIENGQLLILRDGIVYDALGRAIR